MKKILVVQVVYGDYTTNFNYMGILRSQYKDPYKPTGIMESRKVFFVAQLFAPILGGMMFQVDYRSIVYIVHLRVGNSITPYP